MHKQSDNSAAGTAPAHPGRTSAREVGSLGGSRATPERDSGNPASHAAVGAQYRRQLHATAGVDTAVAARRGSPQVGRERLRKALSIVPSRLSL